MTRGKKLYSLQKCVTLSRFYYLSRPISRLEIITIVTFPDISRFSIITGTLNEMLML